MRTSRISADSGRPPDSGTSVTRSHPIAIALSPPAIQLGRGIGVPFPRTSGTGRQDKMGEIQSEFSATGSSRGVTRRDDQAQRQRRAKTAPLRRLTRRAVHEKSSAWPARKLCASRANGWAHVARDVEVSCGGARSGDALGVAAAAAHILRFVVAALLS